MSGRYGQLTTVLQRLGDGLSLLNPVKLVSVARDALRELDTPPPGDPAALRALAAAFRAAATSAQPLALEVRRLPEPRTSAPEGNPSPVAGPLPEGAPGGLAAPGVGDEAASASWRRGWAAAASFPEVRDAAANAIGRAPEAFGTVAAALDALAGQVEEQQRTHAELRRRLREAVRDATHVGRVPAPDPTALDDLTLAIARLIRGCVRVYTDATEAADRAAAVFADAAGVARAGAAWAGASSPGTSSPGTSSSGASSSGASSPGVSSPGTSSSGVSSPGTFWAATSSTGGPEAGVAAARGLSAVDAVVLAARGVRVGGYDGGVLTVAQLRKAGERLDALPATDAAAVRALLGDARSGTERAYLVKALAAGHGPPELAAFAGTIRGRDDAWLHNHLTLIDRGGPGAQDRFGAEVDQCDEYTCGTTSAVVALAEADPAYALRLTSGLEPPYDVADRDEFDRRLTAEQRRVHDATNTVWPRRLGTLPAGIAGWLNEHSGTTGVRYRWRLVDDTDRRDVSAALREVAAAVDSGHPAPVLVGGPVPRHYVLAVGHAGDDLLIFEPTSGDIVRVPAADFTGGSLAEQAGFDHVQAVIVPEHPPERPSCHDEDVAFPH